MRAKNMEFELTYLDRDKRPDWFLKITTHRSGVVLKVDDNILFEPNAIVEYFDETIEPRMHPKDPFKRARNRAWIDFIPTWLQAYDRIIHGKNKKPQAEDLEMLNKTVAILEEAIAMDRGNDGPYFNGDTLCLVDAAYAPSLQRLLILEKLINSGFLNDFPLVKTWSAALMRNECVKNSLPSNFESVFIKRMITKKPTLRPCSK